jgi:hypothetical protein
MYEGLMPDDDIVYPLFQAAPHPALKHAIGNAKLLNIKRGLFEI